MVTKPLGHKAYGSIGHLPNSRLGPGDHSVPEGQARICTVATRDRNDRVIVQEKLDGSCVAVAMIRGELRAVNRAGYPCESSPYRQHHMFAHWVADNEGRFRAVLQDGERIVGEWLAQAHGTLYRVIDNPFVAFDIMIDGHVRLPYDLFLERIGINFALPMEVSDGSPIDPCEGLLRLAREYPGRIPSGDPEGLVYRVERSGRVEFLAKYVRPDKVDGKYLPEKSGLPEVWNWLPNNTHGTRTDRN